LKGQSPDVSALYEVEGKEVYVQFMTQMASYQFHITEGPEVQEILVGAKKGFTVFFTQMVEFKSGVSFRPKYQLMLLEKSLHNLSLEVILQ
jgi:hypothetical protein